MLIMWAAHFVSVGNFAYRTSLHAREGSSIINGSYILRALIMIEWYEKFSPIEIGENESSANADWVRAGPEKAIK